MSGARQQSIEGRIGRGQAETLRQGILPCVAFAQGLCLYADKKARRCEVGWVCIRPPGFKILRSAIVTLRDSAWRRGDTGPQCHLKPLAGKAFSFRLTGTQMSPRAHSIPVYLDIDAAELAPAKVVLKSQVEVSSPPI